MAPKKGSKLLQFDDTTPAPGCRPPKPTQALKGPKRLLANDPSQPLESQPPKRPKTSTAQTTTRPRRTKSPSPFKPPAPPKPTTAIPIASSSKPAATENAKTNLESPPARLDPRTMQPLAACDEFRLTKEETDLVMSSRLPGKVPNNEWEVVAWISMRDGMRFETIRKWRGWVLLEYVEREVKESKGSRSGGSTRPGRDPSVESDGILEELPGDAGPGDPFAAMPGPSSPQDSNDGGDAIGDEDDDAPPPYDVVESCAKESVEPSPRRLRSQKDRTPSYVPAHAQGSSRQPAYVTRATTPSETRQSGRKRSKTPESAAGSSRVRRGAGKVKGKKAAPKAQEVILEEEEEEKEDEIDEDALRYM